MFIFNYLTKFTVENSTNNKDKDKHSGLETSEKICWLHRTWCSCFDHSEVYEAALFKPCDQRVRLHFWMMRTQNHRPPQGSPPPPCWQMGSGSVHFYHHCVEFDAIKIVTTESRALRLWAGTWDGSLLPRLWPFTVPWSPFQKICPQRNLWEEPGQRWVQRCGGAWKGSTCVRKVFLQQSSVHTTWWAAVHELVPASSHMLI